MIVETNNKIRIQDLTIREPVVKQKPAFDVWDYLGHGDFDPVMDLLNSPKSEINWLDDLFQIRIATPEWFEQIEIPPMDIDDLKKKIKNYNTPVNWLESERLLTSAVLAIPEKRDHLMGMHDNSERLIQEIGYQRGRRVTAFDAFDPYFYLSVLYPEYKGVISFRPKEKDGLRIYARTHYRDNTEPLNLRETAKARIMFPQEQDLYKIKDEDWTKINKSLGDRAGRLSTFPRSGQVHKFLLDLASVKILTAPEVKFTKEKGLELIYHNNIPFTDPTKLPERRRF